MKQALGIISAGAVVIFSMPALGAGETPAAAQKHYESMCKSCHGKSGEGNPGLARALKVDPALLVLKDLDKADEELIAVTRDGHGKMPAFKTRLSEDEIRDVVEYIRGLSQ